MKEFLVKNPNSTYDCEHASGVQKEAGREGKSAQLASGVRKQCGSVKVFPIVSFRFRSSDVFDCYLIIDDIPTPLILKSFRSPWPSSVFSEDSKCRKEFHLTAYF